MTRTTSTVLTIALGLCTAAVFAVPAGFAHPHVLSDMRSDLVLDDQGRAVAINVEWVFDEGYTEAATEGMDADGDGVFTSAELKPVVDENIKALKESRYSVQAKADGKDIEYADVTEYLQRINDQGRLQMIFVVPFKEPVDVTRASFTYSIYDPDFFIAYEFQKQDPVSVIGELPKDCSISVGALTFDEKAQETQQMLADKPADWQPEQPTDFGSMFAQPVNVTCKPPAS